MVMYTNYGTYTCVLGAVELFCRGSLEFVGVTLIYIYIYIYRIYFFIIIKTYTNWFRRMTGVVTRDWPNALWSFTQYIYLIELYGELYTLLIAPEGKRVEDMFVAIYWAEESLVSVASRRLCFYVRAILN